ncbi:MAG: hypothetical protein WCW13_04145 [archaeon]|jgi:ElaB/YqjD/DUF883 family membrane-anchored ribosome-binding protein
MESKNKKLYVNAKKEAEIAIAATRKQAKEALIHAKAKFREAEKVVNKKIQTHPEKAVLIAAAIGATIGAIATYGAIKSSSKKN